VKSKKFLIPAQRHNKSRTILNANGKKNPIVTYCELDYEFFGKLQKNGV
jgi:hypothetical protein